MTQSIFLLLAGVVLAWIGGTLFVDGALAGGSDRGDDGCVWHVVP